ncbi:hypothetical protein H1P_80014 [Hyella patelloides LEGE 07179]|uniref:Uncharacterized protein n=1 Tax=Hyella patelloides LEGE 07179 TaxID=945734 RepID=A0A563W430_9CYAN|nr:hypothetical protein H1P_80014 [Hyella patelloides LEGE 07179]
MVNLTFKTNSYQNKYLGISLILITQKTRDSQKLYSKAFTLGYRELILFV